ncbi:penicillin-binding protein 2 [bacterium]|nr:penicillin-binding protein 2 [bacterium]
MASRDLLYRLRLFRLVVILLFAILLGNLFYMTVPQNRHYKDQALENRQIRFRVRAPRGKILDRTGELLADNMFIADITLPVSCLEGDVPDSTLVLLMDWFDLDAGETLDRLRAQRDAERNRLVLVTNAPLGQITAVEERRRQLPGARVETRPRRRYHNKGLFAHVIGYVGEVGQEEIGPPGRAGEYRSGDMIGKQGIERAFEADLRGVSGVKLEEVNASGHIVGRQAVWVDEVVPGRDVQLTLSLELQDAMADILAGQTAGGVAMSCRTGEILAAFSSPTFDTNLMTTSITPEQWQGLVNDPAKPFFNRILQATYPPASLYKVVSSLAALDKGVVGKASRLEPCYGGWQLGDRYFRCWKPSGHGDVDHADALVHSCDTFYYQVGLRLDIDELAAAARSFGLGAPCSGIFPEEVRGLVPDSAWYDEHYGSKGWSRGVLLNNAIGQGELLVTPLQMAVLAARLGSLGTVPAPTFVVGQEDVATLSPLPFSIQDLQWVRSTLGEVVSRGTGKAAGLADVPVAGKTGTAQNPHGEDHAWFMCFAPAGDPEVALAIILENAGHGGSEAAPLAGRWLRTYFDGARPGASPALPLEANRQVLP